MSNRQRMIDYHCGPAIVDMDVYVTASGHERGRAGSYHIERYIWRTEDLPRYDVAIPESLDIGLTNKRPDEAINTRRLTYVPTGRIMYDNTRPPPNATLFEYRLENGRGTRAVSK